MVITNKNAPTGAGGSITDPPLSPPGTSSVMSMNADLTPLQKRIMELANEFMDKHYLLSVESLRTVARRRCTDVDKSEVDKAIDGLVFHRILVDGKARTREKLLENENRRLVYLAVQAEPGIHISKLKASTGMNFRSVQWHLNSLEEFQLVRSVNFGKIKVYFDFTLVNTNDLLHFYLHKDGCMSIFKHLLAHPGCQVGELATQLGIPPSTASRIVKSLTEEGFIEILVNENQVLGICIRENVKPVVNSRIGAQPVQ
jgi:DNA-binding transcriptional ArsR family regulator